MTYAKENIYIEQPYFTANVEIKVVPYRYAELLKHDLSVYILATLNGDDYPLADYIHIHTYKDSSNRTVYLAYQIDYIDVEAGTCSYLNLTTYHYADIKKGMFRTEIYFDDLTDVQEPEVIPVPDELINDVEADILASMADI